MNLIQILSYQSSIGSIITRGCTGLSHNESPSIYELTVCGFSLMKLISLEKLANGFR